MLPMTAILQVTPFIGDIITVTNKQTIRKVTSSYGGTSSSGASSSGTSSSGTSGSGTSNSCNGDISYKNLLQTNKVSAKLPVVVVVLAVEVNMNYNL